METREVLKHLKKHEAVSGSELADTYGVSRNAVWKHVEALRDRGFEIESTPDGYTLESVPEYGGLPVLYHLESSCFVDDVIYHAEVGSTNAVAEELARDGAGEGIVVLAEHQSGGKGRRGRRWESPGGGIWMSVLLRPHIPPRKASIITLAGSVAVARALERLGLEPQIKWPNDVTINGRKLCGILVEMQADAESIDYAVVGIGVNANTKPDIDVPVTSVSNELGREINRASLTASILTGLDELLDSDRVMELWRERSSTLGREVRVETPNDVVSGEAVGVDSSGALRIHTENGERLVAAGDCKHLR